MERKNPYFGSNIPAAQIPDAPEDEADFSRFMARFAFGAGQSDFQRYFPKGDA